MGVGISLQYISQPHNNYVVALLTGELEDDDDQSAFKKVSLTRYLYEGCFIPVDIYF